MQDVIVWVIKIQQHTGIVYIGHIMAHPFIKRFLHMLCQTQWKAKQMVFQGVHMFFSSNCYMTQYALPIKGFWCQTLSRTSILTQSRLTNLSPLFNTVDFPILGHHLSCYGDQGCTTGHDTRQNITSCHVVTYHTTDVTIGKFWQPIFCFYCANNFDNCKRSHRQGNQLHTAIDILIDCFCCSCLLNWLQLAVDQPKQLQKAIDYYSVDSVNQFLFAINWVDQLLFVAD